MCGLSHIASRNVGKGFDGSKSYIPMIDVTGLIFCISHSHIVLEFLLLYSSRNILRACYIKATVAVHSSRGHYFKFI